MVAEVGPHQGPMQAKAAPVLAILIERQGPLAIRERLRERPEAREELSPTPEDIPEVFTGQGLVRILGQDLVKLLCCLIVPGADETIAPVALAPQVAHGAVAPGEAH